MTTIHRSARLLVLGMSAAAVLCGCREATPQALGTLEYDRITLPAPVAERIVSIDVREGQRVTAGQSLLQLDEAQTKAGLPRVTAFRQWVLDQLK